MSEKTGIAWTERTWNPWQGCHKVSEGCRNCYMFRDKLRYGQNPNVVVRSAPATFNAPLRWKEPALVFTCSWSDWFIEEADAWRAEALEIIRQTPHLTYQILTKRVDRMAACLPPDWGDGWPNVWLGVSVENQRTADERIPLLLQTPAAVRFLSCEPLLGPVHLMPLWLATSQPCPDGLPGCEVLHLGPPSPLHWVILGGESGPGARPLDLAWLRSLVAQCRAANVPVFVKQDSGLRPGMQGRIPDELWVKEFPEVSR